MAQVNRAREYMQAHCKQCRLAERVKRQAELDLDHAIDARREAVLAREDAVRIAARTQEQADELATERAIAAKDVKLWRASRRVCLAVLVLEVVFRIWGCLT